MEAKNNIIRRALEQAPGTQLPEGFCERLMERLERESARRERREIKLFLNIFFILFRDIF